MKPPKSTKSVLYVGDSRQMKGGVSAIMRIIEGSPIWSKYSCSWLECQINDSRVRKVMYLVRASVLGLFKIPRYNIIHFHTAIGNSMVVQLPFLIYASLLKKRIVLHLHVGDQLKSIKSKRLLEFWCKRAGLVITLGDSLRQYIPADSNKTTFLYNPAPSLSSRNSPEKYFLFAAYIDSARNKGYDTLIEAFASLHEEYRDWKLMICGDGDTNQLHNYITEYGLSDFVSTPGWVSGEEKAQIFSSAFAYCLPSRQEGMPISVLEALSIGLPIIASPVGCLPEFLVDGESVLFSESGNAKALADNMRRLIEDSELYESISRNGRLIARNKLSIKSFTEKLDSIYSSL